MRTRSRAAFFLAAWAAWAPIVCGQELGPPPRITEDTVFPRELSPQPTLASFNVDTHNRFEVQAFFHWVYKVSEGVSMEWTGSLAWCDPGATSAAYEEATIRRINYFRAMTGLPGDVTLNPDWNAKCQAAALMMSAEGRLSHYPDSSWACYSADGKEAAGCSNLALGNAGPEAIDDYIADPGESNYFVGHRRWILYPPQRTMGTGSVPSSWAEGTYHWCANVLWVIGGFGDRPASPQWVAWPPEGYVPYQVLCTKWTSVYRWSFSYRNADFRSATVTMTKSGSPISLKILNLDKNDKGYADNTIVWEPSGIPMDAPAADTTYTVTISNVVVWGATRRFTYNVTIINPDTPPPSIRVTDISSRPDDRICITFMDSGTGASGYELEIASGLSGTGTWVSDPGASFTHQGAGQWEASTANPPGETSCFYRVKGVP